MPVDPKQLEKALAQIRNAYGTSSVRSGDTYHDPKRISTGSLELDIITGGGLPLGRISHWYGSQFSGKSLTALNTVGNAQDMGLTAAYYDVEKQFNATWAKKHGVDVDKLIVVENTKIEEIGNAMESLMGSVHLHVVDSIPAAISIDELAAKTEEWRPGISARAWGKVLRKIQDRFDGTDNAIILINHVGTVFGKYSGGDEPKGAKFIEYLSSLSIEFRRSSWLYHDEDGRLRPEGKSEDSLSGDTTPAGIEFQARIKKSRVCAPFQAARMRLDFSTGKVDDMWSVTKAAILYGFAVKTSPKSSWYDLSNGGKVQGEYQLRDLLEEDEKFREQVVEKMKEQMG